VKVVGHVAAVAQWFTPDGSRAVTLPTIHSIRTMLEDNWGTPRDAYFDNFALRAAPDRQHRGR
jgi:hypothetical protein